MRLAILVPDLRGGGAERVAVLLATEFLRRGYSVDFVVMRRRGALLCALPGGAEVVELGSDRFRQTVTPLVRYLRRREPGVLVANMWPLTVVASVASAFARRSTRLITVDHTHLSAAHARRGAVARMLLRASLLAYRLAAVRVAVSAGVADDLSYLSSMSREKFEVIHNPVSVNPDMSGAHASVDWGIPPGRRILTVGSLKCAKDHELLIRAFARMPGSEHSRLIILGEGELRQSLLDLAREQGAAERVSLPGYADDPGPYYRSADLFVLSSNYEGFANVIVEALGCGLPVVSTDCPSGPAEILEGGRYGDLVPVGDMNALATAMSNALCTRHDRAMLVARARRFSTEIAGERYVGRFT